MSDHFNTLEDFIARKLTESGFPARRTRASGASTEIGDIYCDDFYVECKIKHSHENIIADREKELQDLRNKMPVQTQKEPVWCYENKYGEKYILLEAETFFRLLKRINEGN